MTKHGSKIIFQNLPNLVAQLDRPEKSASQKCFV